MKQYSIIKPIIWSFFSKSLYQDVRKNWRGLGLLYLLMILAICWLPIFYIMHQNLQYNADHRIKELVSSLPTITVKNGEFSMDKTSPYIIKQPDTSLPFIIFDTSGKYDSLENTPAVVLITKHQVMMRKGESDKIRVYNISKSNDFMLGPAKIHNFVALFVKWWYVIAYPVVLLASFIYRIVQILIFALIGSIFVKMLDTEIDYVTLMRLTAIAITPAIIISTIFDLTEVHFKGILFVYFIISMAYLFFAVLANTHHHELVDPDQPTKIS